jgi:asparagine synthetase B (glutamine-hydrolysing)
MWIEIDLATQAVSSNGFNVKQTLQGTLHYFGELPSDAQTIEHVVASDFCIGVEIPESMSPVRFARDYLGKIPLLFASVANRLFVSDELIEVHGWMIRNGIRPCVSEAAVALYFTAGYVPQGMCIFESIQVCCNASIYEWDGRSTTHISVFSEIAPDIHADISIVGSALESEAAQIAGENPQLDTWCSGGIDSSTIALLYNSGRRKSELLTLSYGQSLVEVFGEGEVPHARAMANACRVPLRTVDLGEEMFRNIHALFVAGHHGPVIDTCLLAKYALASSTRSAAVTGEGGDPVFGGVKNDFVTFYRHQHPKVPIGEIYNLSHKRFGPYLANIMVRGQELNRFASEYFESLFAKYPGELIRQLFYLNTFEKQGGMIFPESYYPAKRSGIRLFHPLTSSRVYQAAFSLTDDKRYVYPSGKLVLTKLYRERLPRSIVNREKSGTQIPLRAYLAAMPVEAFKFECLRSLPMMNTDHLDAVIDGRLTVDKDPLMIYALITLDRFLAAYC